VLYFSLNDPNSYFSSIIGINLINCALLCCEKKNWRRPPPAGQSTESRQKGCRAEIAAAAQ
jgi:hypothetical protein